jgi:hypothetical protein
MSWHGWLIFAVVALPLIVFPLWVIGQYLRARREETETVLRKGLPAEAEITDLRPRGRNGSIPVSRHGLGESDRRFATVPRGSNFAVGDKVAIRYLPGTRTFRSSATRPN